MSDIQNPQAVAEVFSRLDREIWVVTSAVGQQRGGLVATWVQQASIDLETPVVAIALAMNHHTRALVDSSGVFALHLLRPEQVDVALGFALGSGRDRDKLEDREFDSGQTGSPILRECLAWLECTVFDRYAGGDRVYYWADVLAGRVQSSGAPLREQAFFAQCSDQQRAQLRADRESDIRIQRPLSQHWRSVLAPWAPE